MIIIGNHEYELQFTMPIWDKIEDQICMVEQLDDMLMKKGRLHKIALLVAVMSIEQPVSAEKIFRDMEPSDVRPVVAEIRKVINKGLKMRTQQGEDKVVDEVLEEIEKKETQAD